TLLESTLAIRPLWPHHHQGLLESGPTLLKALGFLSRREDETFIPLGSLVLVINPPRIISEAYSPPPPQYHAHAEIRSKAPKLK
ncbi:hypothetical protein HAX54_047138, partial [Datura stramonium]|nr:hypothetical protein [Datura stramonium]